MRSLVNGGRREKTPADGGDYSALSAKRESKRCANVDLRVTNLSGDKLSQRFRAPAYSRPRSFTRM